MEFLAGNQEKSAARYRFGVFEADSGSGELRKSGVRVRLQAQPFRILTFLLEHPGEVIPREELLRRFWGTDALVDIERSLATAIHKIRECLDDTVVNPRYIETLPRVGYRFIAPVAAVLAISPESPPAAEPSLSSSTKPGPEALPPLARPALIPNFARTGYFWQTIAVVGALAALGGYYAAWRDGSRGSDPPHISQVMFSNRFSPGDQLLQRFPGMATDGSRIYFPQIENGNPGLGEVLIADGETGTVPLPEELATPWVDDISPDGSQLLLGNHLSTEPEQPLWIASTLGEAARRIPGILAHDAAWMPDGRHIIYASGDDLYIAQDDGTESHKFVTLPGRAFWLRWSPDQSKLRLTLLSDSTHSPAIWEISADGSNSRLLLGNKTSTPSPCCGSWTPDGRLYVFQSTAAGESNIWAIPDHANFFGWSSKAMRVTNGPLSFQAPIASRDGRHIYFIGRDTRSELFKFDGKTGSFASYSSNLRDARSAQFTWDGRAVAWIRQEGGLLWRSRTDGSSGAQLTTAPLQALNMQWSPDGRQLAVTGRQKGTQWKIFIVDAETGRLQPVLSEDGIEADPSWSPDGHRLVFGRSSAPTSGRQQGAVICVVDLTSQKVSVLPGSEGLISPRWSPDGKYIAAISSDKRRLMRYDIAAKTWRNLAEQKVGSLTFSHDGNWLFFDDFAEGGNSVYKIALATRKVERVGDLSDLGRTRGVKFQFAGLAPGDLPLVNASISAGSIYSADLPR